MPEITGISLHMNHTQGIMDFGSITGESVIIYKIKGRILRCNFCKVMVGGLFYLSSCTLNLKYWSKYENDFPHKTVKQNTFALHI